MRAASAFLSLNMTCGFQQIQLVILANPTASCTRHFGKPPDLCLASLQHCRGRPKNTHSAMLTASLVIAAAGFVAKKPVRVFIYTRDNYSHRFLQLVQDPQVTHSPDSMSRIVIFIGISDCMATGRLLRCGACIHT